MKFTKGVHGTDGLASWQDQSKVAVRLKSPLIPPCACTVHVLRMLGGCLGAARYMSATALGVDGAVRPGLYPEIHLILYLGPEEKFHALSIYGIASCLTAPLKCYKFLLKLS